MSARIELKNVSPDVMKAMMQLQATVTHSGLEKSLVELVKMRASQINGCAYCLDMHSKDALAMGESPQRLFLLDAWREAPFYTERERAAILWTETLTLVAEKGVPDDVYEEVRGQFDEDELTKLTLAIVAINGWNRICIGFQIEPGDYQPAGVAKSASEKTRAMAEREGPITV